jgi:hypothetical protein
MNTFCYKYTFIKNERFILYYYYSRKRLALHLKTPGRIDD